MCTVHYNPVPSSLVRLLHASSCWVTDSLSLILKLGGILLYRKLIDALGTANGCMMSLVIQYCIASNIGGFHIHCFILLYYNIFITGFLVFYIKLLIITAVKQ